jgi:hypothetical protein
MAGRWDCYRGWRIGSRRDIGSGGGSANRPGCRDLRRNSAKRTDTGCRSGREDLQVVCRQRRAVRRCPLRPRRGGRRQEGRPPSPLSGLLGRVFSSPEQLRPSGERSSGQNSTSRVMSPSLIVKNEMARALWTPSVMETSETASSGPLTIWLMVNCHGPCEGYSAFIRAKCPPPRMRSLDCGHSQMKSGASTAHTDGKSFVAISRQNSRTIFADEDAVSNASGFMGRHPGFIHFCGRMPPPS